MYDINKIILAILKSPWKYFNIIQKAEDDIRYFRNTYEGLVEEEIFVSLIAQSRNDGYIERFLSALIVSADPQEITNVVFSALLRYKGEFRRSILTGLAHCPLSYYQLIALNKLRIDEALYQLIKLYVSYDCFTTFDLQELLRPWKNKLPQYVYRNILYCLDDQDVKRSNDVKKECIRQLESKV